MFFAGIVNLRTDRQVFFDVRIMPEEYNYILKNKGGQRNGIYELNLAGA